MLLILSSSANALTPAPKKRPFDQVPGVVAACLSSPAAAWTVEACADLLQEARKHAVSSSVKLAVQEFTPDLQRGKLPVIDGFDGDKAIRLVLSFEGPDANKRVSFKLASNFIFMPTAKDIPNVVPGQRIPQNFFVQGATFEPGVNAKTAKPTLDTVLETFFEVGDGKYQ